MSVSAAQRTARRRDWSGPLLWLVLPAPALWLVFGAFTGRLGVNPAETLIHETGQWALRFLLLTLAATPLARLARITALARHRRLLGLWAAGYVFLHLLSYAWLDQALDWSAIWQDVLKRPFIAAGATAAVLLVPLAFTSFNAAVRALGPRAWQRLHRAVYVAAGAAVLHLWWSVSMGKAPDYTEATVYAAVLAVLLGARRVPARRRRPAGAR